MMIKRVALINARGKKTQEEMAEICGVKQQTYSHWETGRATPSIKMMVFLEKELSVPKEELFFDIFNSFNECGEQFPTGTDC